MPIIIVCWRIACQCAWNFYRHCNRISIIIIARAEIMQQPTASDVQKDVVSQCVGSLSFVVSSFNSEPDGGAYVHDESEMAVFMMRVNRSKR